MIILPGVTVNPKSRPQIALLVEASRAYGRELLRGVAFFARTQVNWSLLHQEMMLDSEIPDWMTSSRIDGVIARVDSHTIDPLRKLKVPIVDVRCNREFTGIPQVETDNRLVAELAFKHLWNRGFRRFAFCGFRSAAYSEARLKYFRVLVEQASCPFTHYESKGKPGGTLTSLEYAGMMDIEPMSKNVASVFTLSLYNPLSVWVHSVRRAIRHVFEASVGDSSRMGIDHHRCSYEQLINCDLKRIWARS